MASSNRHWPSMFKSKPCNSTVNYQWPNERNASLISPTASNRTPYSQGPGCEERVPEPKPRWNPRPEQIRILEAIFNSGMVNPPRDEIRKIRVQLQEYGQVGDANVFYWFQNRKSRSKHKQRHLQTVAKHHQPPPPAAVAPISSSSSSGKSSTNSSNEKTLSAGPATTRAAVVDYLNSPTASVNQRGVAQAPSEVLAEQFLFPMQQRSAAAATASFCFPDGGGGVSVGLVDQDVASCQNFSLAELMLMSGSSSKIRDEDDHEKMKLEEQLGYGGPDVPNPAHPFLPPAFYSSHYQIPQGVLGESEGPTKATVFINDVCLEVSVGPFNVRETFGEDVVLIESCGQPVLTDEWGVTLHPLHHGAFYYLLRPFTPLQDGLRTFELI